MAGIGDLHAFAELLLTSAAEALDTVPTFDPALDGAQTRQFVSPGQPAFDCPDQLTVHVPLIQRAETSPGGNAAGRVHQAGMINQPTLLITSTRCIPQPTGTVGIDYKPPSAAALGTAAKQLDADGWALWNHLYWLQSSELLLSLCDEVFFDGIQALVPSGGSAGWLVQVRVALDGYQVVFGT